MGCLNDVAPEIYEKVNKRFEYLISRNDKIKRSLERLEKGTATFEDAYYYAQNIGYCLADAFSLITDEDLPDGRMYYNIAQKAVEPFLVRSAGMCEDYAERVVKLLNEKAGLGLNPV